MGITHLYIQGFKSLKQVTWKPGKLNVIIGANGTGKSNLLQLLDLLQASAIGKLSDRVLALGGIEALRWDLTYPNINIFFASPSPVNTQHILTYHFFMYSGYASAFNINDEYLKQEDISKPYDSPRHLIERTSQATKIASADGSAQTAVDIGTQTETTLFSIAPVAGVLNADGRIPLFQRNLASWRIYNYIDSSPSAQMRKPSLTRIENYLDRDGSNLPAFLHTHYTNDRNFKRAIDSAMSSAFGEDYGELVFSPASDHRIQMRIRWKSLTMQPSAEVLSDGTLKFLALIGILANPMRVDLIAIDEPEAGLHPRMQEIISDYAVEASDKTQIIFTTHSPEFLDGFYGEKPTVTVAELDRGETTLKQLDGEELAYWVKGYSLGSLYRSGQLENMAAATAAA